MERLVFSNGKWVTISLPIGHDPCWTDADKWVYASASASASSRCTQGKAEQLAEALVFKRIYKVSYDKTMEKQINNLWEIT